MNQQIVCNMMNVNSSILEKNSKSSITCIILQENFMDVPIICIKEYGYTNVRIQLKKHSKVSNNRQLSMQIYLESDLKLNMCNTAHLE